MPPKKPKNMDPPQISSAKSPRNVDAKNVSAKSQTNVTGPSQDDNFNCRCCDQPDSADDMVQCDQCSGWCHFSCVGVNTSIQNKDYLCPDCTGKSSHSISVSENYSAALARLTTNKKSVQEQSFMDVAAIQEPFKGVFVPSTSVIASEQPTCRQSDITSSLSLTVKNSIALGEPMFRCETVMSPTQRQVNAFNQASTTKRYSLPSGLQQSLASYTLAPTDTSTHERSNWNIPTLSAPIAAELAAACTIPNQLTSVSTSALAPIWSTLGVLAPGAAEVAAKCETSTAAFIPPTPNLVASTIQTTAAHGATKVANKCRFQTNEVQQVTVPQNKEHLLKPPSFSAHRATEAAAMCGKVRPTIDTAEGASVSSKSTRYSTSKLKIALQKVEEELKLRQERETEYLNKKYNIMSQIMDSSDEEQTDADLFQLKNSAKENVDRWISDKVYFNSTTNAVACSESKSSTAQPLSEVRNISRQQTCTDTNQHQSPIDKVGGSGAQAECLYFRNEAPELQRTCTLMNQRNEPSISHQFPPRFEGNLPGFQSGLQNASSNNVLTKNHLAARHLIRDLPIFDGNPSEWPLFLASYIRSTELGGFSNEENLLRLHRSLKGDALEAVKSLIIQPNCVERVIATLKMLFGRPELVINTLIQTIKSTPAPKADKFDTIVTFAIAVQNLCATFEASGIINTGNYPMLLQELVEKLPPSLRLNWAMHKQSLEVSTLAEFNIWMYSIAEAANGILTSAPISSTEKKKNQNKNWRNKEIVNNHYEGIDENTSRSRKRCCICNSNCVSVSQCKQFLQFNRTDRWNAIREHRLCSRCLKNHPGYRCKSNTLCKTNDCNLKHHPLLHRHQVNEPIDTATVGVHDEDLADSKTSPVLFKFIPVFLYGRGVKIEVFAFFDEGSSVTLLDEEVAKQLNLEGEKQPLCLKWTGNATRLERSSEILNLQISRNESNVEKFPLTNVRTVRKLALPSQTLNWEELQSKFQHLQDLSIVSYSKAVPRILIGVNNAKLGFPFKSKEGRWNEPIATKTRLGWVVHGNCTSTSSSYRPLHSFHACACNVTELQRLVNNFICDDNFGINETKHVLASQDDARALELLRTHTRKREGRFETTLLWRFDDVRLPDSFPMAKRRLICLQKRMARNPDLEKLLNQKISEYVEKGYARRITDKEIAENEHRSWYLPIFPVENVNKPGKIRIVWDAAASTNGTSLNSVLLKGPDQLTPLTSVIYKFRQQRVAICGDIKEMFHQIKIREEDQHYQRFLWGGNEIGKPHTYVLTVMTFGATCSPCTAHYVKNTNADPFTAAYPRAVQSIKENHYVDDLMDSVPTISEGIQLAQAIRDIHQQGGFHIRNWVSNSAEVLKALGAESVEQMNVNTDVEHTTEKVLGMWWCTSKDCFIFKFATNRNRNDILFGTKRPTKREILRVMMTIFDPLGLIACFLMYIKILLQDIWRSKIEWDEVIKDDEYKKWTKWINLLPAVETVEVPRCYISIEWAKDIQLHVFVDASENGYAAVAYVRNPELGSFTTRLIGAKTRVAPLKSLSIPRLELQAALLGARFAKSIAESHSIHFKHRFFWSDSKTVLCWIRSDHRKYRQFVAFRVSEILELTLLEEWRWIPSKSNVADEATKWQKLPDLKPDSRWLNGPKFLKQLPDDWPQDKVAGSTAEELKTNFVGVHTNSEEQVYKVDRFSNWKRLLRSAAYVQRFIHNASTPRTKLSKSNGCISSKELQLAENSLLKEAQNSEYAEEKADLKRNHHVQRSSNILNLNPFLDEKGVLRANGRVCLAANVSRNSTQPIILPKRHKITLLIVNDVHRKYKHLNDETVINDLRQKFFIAHLRSVLKFVKKSCQLCKNNKAQPRPPIMAPLPTSRLSSFCLPFSYVGVDYFGPMTVAVGRRTEKRWGVLFTCLTIRAIHIEIAHTLSSDSCILCVRNFIARRGTPIEFHSDNGTNFRGTERELREAAEVINRHYMEKTFTSTTTRWKFIPPGAPHMGGSWERLIRSVKSVLYAIMPTRNYNDELLRSMLMEIENIVNSRPLTYIPISLENPEALTPNHFILGSGNGSKPAAEFVDDSVLLRKNWLVSQQFADRFWKRWVLEYLPTLTRRSKWFNKVKPLQVGDLVLVIDPNNPRNTWPKGRIIKVTPSNDGQVRSATVQTKEGIYDRPSAKLAILDIDESTNPDEKLLGGSVSANALN